MRFFKNFIRIVIMAAFVLGAFVPAMSGAQQTDMDHAQMLSMAGHSGAMEQIDGNTPDALQIMVCKQYCMIASAILPIGIRPPAEIGVTYTNLPRPGAWFAPSLTLPPPGRPPKVMMV